MIKLKITLTSVIMLLLTALFFALTACSPAAEQTFATPTATIAQFVEVEEEAMAQKATSTATVMAATRTATPSVAKATKTINAEVAHTKTSTPKAAQEEASPTPDAAQKEASPTPDAAQEEASPTQEEASPTPDATQEQASLTTEQASPTAEASDSSEAQPVAATDMTVTPSVAEAAPTETVPVATWHALPTKTPTIPSATIAPATSTAVISSPEVTATPDVASEASDMAGLLNQIANPNKSEDESASESQETLIYLDRELAIAFDVPADWTIDSQPGASGAVYAPEEEASLRFSVLNQESNTLELALEEVKQGAFGPYITKTEPVKLGQFDGLRLNLAPNDVEGGASVLWLMMTPVGRTIGFIPQGDLTLIEPILSTVRGVR